MTGIFNMTGSRNVQDFTDFENLVISVILNKISEGVYEIWQHLVTPCPLVLMVTLVLMVGSID